VGYFYDDGMIYIATRADSRKSRNLQRDARCCVVVDVLKGGVGKGLMLTGKAEIAKGAEFRRLKVRIGKLAGWHLDRWDVGGHSPDSMIVFRPAKAATIGQI
jgi:nitroimidazol reductase NimA-like FMN-containing flavoprotein (pyridoxamine 5'-phosphate oxidase superfamily)